LHHSRWNSRATQLFRLHSASRCVMLSRKGKHRMQFPRASQCSVITSRGNLHTNRNRFYTTGANNYIIRRQC
jgi:hypothetical protein